MASSVKIIISLIFALLLVVTILASPVPGKSYQKVRIHVPVKHHTHVITRTKVKTVHIGIPIKEPEPVKHWDEDWAYSKKRTRVTLPETDDLDY